MTNEVQADLTVILPCAGSGTRLGTKEPKELFEIVPGTCLIDFSLAHIEAALSKKAIKVAVVIRPWKKEVVDHVRRKLPGVNVEAVMFDERYQEWPGSVYSAAEMFSNQNLVLLPDSILNVGKAPGKRGPNCYDDKGLSLIESVSEVLLCHGVVFGWIECGDSPMLKKLGALRVKEGKVIAFQDKPGESLWKYNGFWGCYAFTKDAGRPLYDFLVKSVLHQRISLEELSFYPPGAIRLESYGDLGTWPAVRKFRREF
jgi:hypothetical protein